MVIHGGGVYGEKEKTIDRWCENYEKLPDKIKNRLVLENCEKCYSIKDCLKIHEKCGVPIVFDTHHYDCYIQLHPDEEFEEPEYYIPLILETWNVINQNFNLNRVMVRLVNTVPHRSYLLPLEIPKIW